MPSLMLVQPLLPFFFFSSPSELAAVDLLLTQDNDDSDVCLHSEVHENVHEIQFSQTAVRSICCTPASGFGPFCKLVV